jgi:hypothetical protein
MNPFQPIQNDGQATRLKPKPARASTHTKSAVASAVLFCATAFSLPAHADKAVKDQALIQILEELKTNQKEEFGKNVDRWEEVSELLKKYIAYSKAEEVRHGQWQQNNTLLDKTKKDDFAKTFKGLTSGVRDVKGTDISSKALASGLKNGAASTGSGGLGGLGGLGGSGGGLPDITSLGDFMKLISDGLGQFSGLSTESFLPMLTGGTFLEKDQSDALAQVLKLHSVDDIKNLVTSATVNNAKLPNGDVMTKGVKEALERTKLRSDTAGQDLAAVKATASGTGSRLSAIEALVQQANALGAVDPKTGKPNFDGAKLAELRAYMSSVSAMQNEELVKLSAKEMGDRATDNLMSGAATAAKLQNAVNLAKGK